MVRVVVSLVAIGGFPGAGKSLVSQRLAQEFSLPRLSSDILGGTIGDALGERLSRSDAFWAAYEVLFTLAEQFVGVGCSVVVDMSLGWDFQWQRLDDIVTRLPDTTCLPVILDCPKEVCAERMDRRYRQDAAKEASAEKILAMGQVADVWDYLQKLDRPDACIVDADRDADSVYADVRRHLAGTPRRAVS